MPENSARRPSYNPRHIDLVEDRLRVAEEVCDLLAKGWTQDEVAQALALERTRSLHPNLDDRDLETLAGEPANRVSRGAISQLATSFRTIVGMGLTPDRVTFDAVYRVVASGGTAAQRRGLVARLAGESSGDRRTALIRGMNDIYAGARGSSDGAAQIVRTIEGWRVENLSGSERILIAEAVERKLGIPASSSRESEKRQSAPAAAVSPCVGSAVDPMQPS